MAYTEEFKAGLVRRICGPGGPTAYQVALETGIGASTVYSWVKRARTRSSMGKRKERRGQDWTAAERLSAINEAAGLDEEELGLFLRKAGLFEADLAGWREQATAALAPQRRSAKDRLKDRKIKNLQKELRRKDAALAEAAALLVLSKKMNALWEDEGENT